LHQTTACAQIPGAARSRWRPEVPCAPRLRQRQSFSRKRSLQQPKLFKKNLTHTPALTTHLPVQTFQGATSPARAARSRSYKEQEAHLTGLRGEHSRLIIVQDNSAAFHTKQGSYFINPVCVHALTGLALLRDFGYRQVPKCSPYGSVCCACAQRPGLPRASPSRAR
jgi:hypothetical protein